MVFERISVNSPPLPLQMRLVTSVAFRAIFHECFLSLLYFAGKCLHRRSKRRGERIPEQINFVTYEDERRGGGREADVCPLLPPLSHFMVKNLSKEKSWIFIMSCRAAAAAGFTHFRDGRHEKKTRTISLARLFRCFFWESSISFVESLPVCEIDRYGNWKFLSSCAFSPLSMSRTLSFLLFSPVATLQGLRKRPRVPCAHTCRNKGENSFEFFPFQVDGL